MNDKNYAWKGFCNIIDYCITGITKCIIYASAIGIGSLIVLFRVIIIPIFLLRKLGGDPNTSFKNWIASIGSFPASLVNKKSTVFDEYNWGGTLLGTIFLLILALILSFRIESCENEIKQREVQKQEMRRQEFQRKLDQANQEKEEFKKEHPITYKTIEYSKDVLNYIF